MSNSLDPDLSWNNKGPEWVNMTDNNSEKQNWNNKGPEWVTMMDIFFWLCWGLTTRQPLRVILCRLPEKGRKEIEERVEMKERDREERGTGMEVKKQKK